MHGNGRDAPFPDLRGTVAGLACKVFSGRSACGTDNPTGSTWSLVPIAV